MRMIECPNSLQETDDDFFTTWVFLAGGITDCPDWQKEMIERFKDVDDLVLFNPRRKEFDITNPTMSEQQIEWEHEHLKTANAVLFWFPYHALCPITLFELGAAMSRGATVFVGCHPAYPRYFDVVKQVALERPSVKVRDNFADLVEDVKRWHRTIPVR